MSGSLEFSFDVGSRYGYLAATRAPTMFVGDAMFFGSDRSAFVEQWSWEARS